MRTTVIIDDLFGERLRSLVSRRKLSDFINECLREHFGKEEKVEKFRKLEKSYARASAKGKPVSKDFEVADLEEWPEW